MQMSIDDLKKGDVFTIFNKQGNTQIGLVYFDTNDNKLKIMWLHGNSNMMSFYLFDQPIENLSDIIDLRYVCNLENLVDYIKEELDNRT